MWPRPRALATPLTPRLSDSVPPDVKTISSFATPKKLAMRSRAVSRPSRASRPKPWMLDGLPKRSPKYGSIASITSGWTGVEALWSR